MCVDPCVLGSVPHPTEDPLGILRVDPKQHLAAVMVPLGEVRVELEQHGPRVRGDQSLVVGHPPLGLPGVVDALVQPEGLGLGYRDPLGSGHQQPPPSSLSSTDMAASTLPERRSASIATSSDLSDAARSATNYGPDDEFVQLLIYVNHRVYFCY